MSLYNKAIVNSSLKQKLHTLSLLKYSNVCSVGLL